MGAHDTAVATAEDQHRTPMTTVAAAETPAAGTLALSMSMSSSSLSDVVGMTLSGRYLVTRKVGQGGMGAVFEATDTRIGKRVAVKVLLEKYAQREAIVQRLEKEARLASSIGNEHIIDITDFGKTENDRTFVVMEFLEGESLAECLAREPKLSEQRILRVVQQAALALSAAHAKEIVHRDIKPENLFLLRRKDQDFVKVVDFGISKSLRATGEEEEQPRLTQTGMVLGTPLYMSPEQARGDDELDHRVDVYALGVIMYEAATGRVPFVGNNYLSVISQVLNEDPTPPREIRPDLSEEFEAITMKAMAKDRKDRYASMRDMLTDLGAVLDDPTHSTERAKITGPRKKAPQRSPGRFLIYAGGVTLIIASVVVVAKVLMGPAPAKRAVVVPDDAAIAVTIAVDAPVAAVVIDAPEETKQLEVLFESQPSGAEISIGGAVKGLTPKKISVVLTNKEVSGALVLAGYDEQPITFNPLELAKDKVPRMFVRLKKPKTGTPYRAPKTGGGSGSGSGGPKSNPNPDFNPNPFNGGGNVPTKK